jgi:ornithine cyclodeaminase/alanine dehydrogenase-like protein (mu-crystallin family)
MHETYLSGFRVGATTALGVAECARPDAEVLGLFGTGNQAFHNCRAICSVRPIKRVKVFSPNAEHRKAFVARMTAEKVEVIAVDDPREAVRGAHIVCCATNAKVPVLKGEWLELGQMVVTICNSDVLDTRSEVDEATFARAGDIIVNDWEGVVANRQVELLDPIERSIVKRERVHELRDIVAGKVRYVRRRSLFSITKTTRVLRFSSQPVAPSSIGSSSPKAQTAQSRANGSRARNIVFRRHPD